MGITTTLIVRYDTRLVNILPVVGFAHPYLQVLHAESHCVLALLDQHVPAVQNLVRTVTARRGERIHRPAQTRPFPSVCHPGVGHRPVAV